MRTLLLTIPATLALAAATAAARDAKGDKSAAAPATSASPKGMILRRDEPGANYVPDAKWSAAGENEPLPAGVLLVGLPGAELVSADGGVRVKLLTDFDSPLPVLEPAVILHPAGKKDLDLTLDRGMIELVNSKKRGVAEVRVRVRDQTFDLTLYTPGAKATLLLASAWPKGVPFKKDADPKDVPLAQLLVIAQKGEVDVRNQGRLAAL